MKNLYLTAFYGIVLLCISISLGAQTTYTIGTGTNYNGGYSSPSPFAKNYDSAKEQYILTAQELTNAGITSASNIFSIAFDVYNDNGMGTLNNYEVKLGLTQDTAFTEKFITTNLETVYYTNTLDVQSGWNTLDFMQPFFYDGTSNVVIQVCHSGNSSTSSASVYFEYTTNALTAFAGTYGGEVCSNNLSNSVFNQRPNMQLSVAPAPDKDLGVIVWQSPQVGDSPNSNMPITIAIKNFGTQSQSSFQAAYSIDAGNTIVSETVSATIAPGDTLQYTFTQTADMSVSQLYETGAAVTLLGDTMNHNDSIFAPVYICSPLSGTYTVGGSSNDFDKIEDAVFALNACGVGGPVTFSLASGTYNEQIDLGPVAGMSATNTVTFESASGNAQDVKWEYSSNNWDINFILRLNGASNFIVKNISFEPLSPDHYQAVVLTNSCTDILIDGNRFVLPTNSYNNYAAIEISVGNSCHRISILNNQFSGGQKGVNAVGENSSSLSKHIIVNNNYFTANSTYALHLENQDSCMVRNNTFELTDGSGISLQYASNGFIVDANKLSLSPSSGVTGIYLYNANASNNLSPGWITNNMISIHSGSNQRGISLASSHNFYIAHNSIYIEQGNSSTAGIYQTSGSTATVINNNISAKQGRAFSMFESATDSLLNNNFYTYGNTPIGSWSSSNQNNLVVINNHAISANNISEDPQFYSPNDLHVTSNKLNNAGRVLPEVSLDFDGEARSSSPDIGADEFTPANFDVKVISLGESYNPCALTGTVTIKAVITNLGLTAVNNIPIKYSINGGNYVSETISSTLAFEDTIVYNFSTPASFTTAGFHDLEILVDLSNDQIRGNDTLMEKLFKVNPISIPSAIDFEDATQHFLYPINQAQTKAYYIDQNHINGTRAIQMEGGAYNGWNSYSSEFAQIQANNSDHHIQVKSCSIDATAISGLRMSFDLAQSNSGSRDYNWFYVKANSTDFLKDTNGDSIFQTPGIETHEQQLEFDLSAYTGTNFDISFEAYLYLDDYNNGGNGDKVQLDNIRLWEPKSIDVGITNILSADSDCGAINDSIFLEIKNFGFTDVSNIPYYAEAITPLGTTVFHDTLKSTIPAYGSAIIFAGLMNTVFNGNIDGFANTYLSGDQEGANDTLKYHFVQKAYLTIPYRETFENGDDDWDVNGFTDQDGSYIGSSGNWKMADIMPYITPGNDNIQSLSSSYTLFSSIPFGDVTRNSYLVFDYYLNGKMSSGDSIGVFVSSDCGDNWDQVFTFKDGINPSFHTNSDGSSMFMTSVGAYDGSKLKVGVACYSGYNQSIMFSIDNFGIANGLAVELGTDTAICDADTITLSSNYSGSGYTYTWYNEQGNIIANTESIRVHEAGFYACEVGANNTIPGIDTIKVDVHPGFGAYFHTTDFTLCEGESKLGQVQLNGVPPFSIDVFDGTNTKTHIAHNFFFDTLLTPLANTSYMLYNMIDGNGCVFTDMIDSIHATVNPLPTVSIDNIDPDYCVSDTSITLTATPSGGIFSGWAVNAGEFKPNDAAIGNQYITYNYSDANGCGADTTIQTFVHPLPQVAITNAPTGDYCQNDITVNLNAFPSGGIYTNPLGGGNIFDPSLASIGSNEISYRFTDTYGCTNSDTVQINVVAPTAVSISTALNASYCSNEGSVNLTAIPAGGIFTVNGTNTNIFDPSSVVPGAIEIIYSYTDGNNCISSDTISTIVYAQPMTVITTQLQADYCENNAPVSLSAFPSGGVFSGGGVIPDVFDPAQATIGSNKIYYTYTDANGCSQIDSASTTVHSLPLVSIGTIADVCQNGGNTQLSGATPAGGYYSGNGIYGTSNNLVPTALNVGLNEIVYHYSDTFGCENSDTTQVRIVGVPDATFTLPAMSCAGDSVDLTFTGTVSPNATYNWNFDNAVIHLGSNEGPYSLKWDNSGVKVLTLAVTDSGCTSATKTEIINITQGFAQITSAGNTQLCYGDSVVLFANAAPGYTYQWHLNGSPLTTSTSFQNATSNGHYYCEVTDAAGCKASSDSILVEINAELTSDFSLPNIACINDMVNIQFAGSSSPTATYTWDFDGATVASGNQAGPYNVIWSSDSLKTVSLQVSEGNCSSSITTHNIDIIGTQASITTLGATSFCSGGNVVLYANTGAYHYQWKKDGSDIANATQAFLMANQSGDYTVQVTDTTNACWAISDTVDVVVHDDNFNLAFTADQTQINIPPFNVSFTNQTPNANDYYWAWSFGDGNVSAVKDPSHQYLFDGSYDVGLIAQNIQTGCVDTLVKTNYINCSGGSPNPCNLIAAITVMGPSSICPGDSVLLEAAINPGGTYQWIRDGILLIGETDSVLWAKDAGAYQIIVTDTACSEFSTPTLISVHSVIVPTIMANGQIVPCTNDSMELLVPTYFNQYAWSNGSSSQSIFIKNSGDYIVTVTDANGCATASQPYVVNASLISKPNICIVGVDTATNTNRVIWERQANSLIDSFRVYRESTVAGVYDLIATKSVNDQSLVIDNNSNPMQRAYRYRISAIDTCGSESPMSDYHKTIHLTINAGLNNTWNLIWDGYVGFNFGSYRIYRGIDSTQMTLLTQIQSSLTSYTDLNPPAGKVYYQIEVVSPHDCYPDSLYAKAQSNYNTSRSNVTNSSIAPGVGIQEPINHASFDLKVYPNPNNGSFLYEINASVGNKYTVEMLNTTGQRIFIEEGIKVIGSAVKEVNKNNLAKGVYYLRVFNGTHQQVRKIVIN